MKKYADIMLFVLVFIVPFASVNAQPIYSRLNSVGNGGVLFNVSFTGTVDDFDYHQKNQSYLNGFQVYAGIAVSGHCSANVLMQEIVDWGNEYSDEFLVPLNRPFPFYSGNIFSLIGPGKNCIKINAVEHVGTYSTGDIQLVWDANQGKYTSAMPTSLQINLP